MRPILWYESSLYTHTIGLACGSRILVHRAKEVYPPRVAIRSVLFRTTREKVGSRRVSLGVPVSIPSTQKEPSIAGSDCIPESIGNRVDCIHECVVQFREEIPCFVWIQNKKRFQFLQMNEYKSFMISNASHLLRASTSASDTLDPISYLQVSFPIAQ